jgi:hypothetical protein
MQTLFPTAGWFLSANWNPPLPEWRYRRPSPEQLLVAASRLVLKNTLEFTKIIDEVEYNFGTTLYLDEPHQGDDGISLNWLLNEFQEPTYQAFKAPKTVLLIEETVGETEVTYAITFVSSYFRIDKFYDKDFGFKFASRMEYTNVKTTTLTAPNLN